MTSKHKSVPFPWLTVEMALWGAVLILALGLRLPRLDAALLNADEARGALAAWRWATGGGLPATAQYSPALLSGQWLLFLIASANELTARLWPALAGAALALTPALWRARLGRVGALLAGGLLALSPTAVALSRTASGDVLAGLGVSLSAAGMWRFLTQRDRRDVHLTTLGLALAMASSPLGYSALIVLAAAFALTALVDLDARQRFFDGWRTFQATPQLPAHATATLVGGFVLLCTALGWNLSGVGAAAAQISDWLGGFVRWPDSLSAGYPVLVLVVYEPLVLLTGGAGMALATWRGQASALFFSTWAIAALTLALLRPGHGPGDVLLVVIPLAFLGGVTLDALIESTRRWGQRFSEGLYLAVSAPLWVYALLNLANYTNRAWQQTRLGPMALSLPTFLSLAMTTLFVILLIAIGLGWLQGIGPMLRGLGLSTTLALLLVTVSTAWGVSQNRPDNPAELLVLRPTAPEVRLLRANLARLGNERRGDARALDLTVLSEDPALEWALRDFERARFSSSADSPITTLAIVAPAGVETLQIRSSYVGQSFPLRRTLGSDMPACQWNFVQQGADQVRQLDCVALVKWLLFRENPDPSTEERVVLWVQQTLARP